MNNELEEYFLLMWIYWATNFDITHNWSAIKWKDKAELYETQ